MKNFLDENFLLNTDTAKSLYFDYAAKMPIIDYHCHVNPKEIWEDKQFLNITELWLSGDHYKWRLMRSDGVDEYYITGDADPYEKFYRFASLMPKAIGNPMYHWCHLELKNYFGYDGVLSAETAKEVWELTKEKLGKMSVRSIIEDSNVKFIGTTDDPIDSLEYHKLLANDATMKARVAPSFRPDKALNIDKAGWREYIDKLAIVSEIDICDLDSLCEAIKKRIEYFASVGCCASDHGLDYMVYENTDHAEADKILKMGLRGENITQVQANKLKTYLLVFCAKEYSRLGWVMQLHYNCQRNPNSKMFGLIGPDTGFDCIAQDSYGTKKLAMLLDKINSEGNLPKTIVYSLDPSDNAAIDTLIGAFQSSGACGKIQHGSAWWFNDNKEGMKDQLVSLANLSLLGNFVGMLTDSRSFLSYTRHEYFRRILCSLIGEWVENGEYPSDMKYLGKIVEDISYNNAKKYFGI